MVTFVTAMVFCPSSDICYGGLCTLIQYMSRKASPCLQPPDAIRHGLALGILDFGLKRPRKVRAASFERSSWPQASSALNPLASAALFAHHTRDDVSDKISCCLIGTRPCNSIYLFIYLSISALPKNYGISSLFEMISSSVWCTDLPALGREYQGYLNGHLRTKTFSEAEGRGQKSSCQDNPILPLSFHLR
ncbi:hypothetical protein C8J56DRAFT_462277 [Mycena floridula]|nr:hypothetical protein C8J56DRAFT_462277 [Mycena floridula]